MNPRQLSSEGWISASVDALDGALGPMVGMEIIEIETLRRDGVPGPDGFRRCRGNERRPWDSNRLPSDDGLPRGFHLRRF